jgi:hypothetical protein
MLFFLLASTLFAFFAGETEWGALLVVVRRYPYLCGLTNPFSSVSTDKNGSNSSVALKHWARQDETTASKAKQSKDARSIKKNVSSRVSTGD